MPGQGDHAGARQAGEGQRGDLAESILVTVLGAITGIVIGAPATGVNAVSSHQSLVVPYRR